MHGKISNLFLILLNLTRSERQDDETRRRIARKGLWQYVSLTALRLALLFGSAVRSHVRVTTFAVHLIIQLLPVACSRRNLLKSFSLGAPHEELLQIFFAPFFTNSDSICK